MAENKQIKTALISVYHKDGLDKILRILNDNGVRLLSTGGTQSFIQQQGYKCDAVEDLTGYPSILGGRVKTLHPKVFGGILNRRDNNGDKEQIAKYDIPEIDLVIVDLYPFEDTVASGASHGDIIEKIDIGGISLIRAAAKNYKDVVIVASKAQYEPLYNKFMEYGSASTTEEDRLWFAKEAFAVSSAYDSHIFNYFDQDCPSALRLAVNGAKVMRYGENPHQKGYFFGNFDEMFTQLHGKEISYNNLLDIDAAVNLMADFTETSFGILKHNNACGFASRPTVLEAWKDALAGDPVSAFGGVLITNAEVDAATAEEMHKIFFDLKNLGEFKTNYDIKGTVFDYMGSQSLMARQQALNNAIKRYDYSNTKTFPVFMDIITKELILARQNMIKRTGRAPENDLSDRTISQILGELKKMERYFINGYAYQSLK